MTVAFITHSDCLLHEMGPEHPEAPSRLAAIQDALVASGLEPVLQHRDAPRATREQLYRVHDADYVESLFARVPGSGLHWLDGDTALGPGTLDAALRAAGAVVQGVDLVCRGEAGAAFCSVRPPGHHAERHRAMGFCFFNNVAVGVAHALAVHGLERVAVADFDVHHGNGTEQIFAARPGVLLCSTFQHPFYPHSGADSDAPHVVNVPLPPGAGGAAFRAAVRAHWLPALEDFRPQLLLVSAGFDGHLLDEMAHLRLVEADYAWVTKQLKAMADTYAGGRLVSVLEGGYRLEALGRSVVAHVDALLGHR